MLQRTKFLVIITISIICLLLLQRMFQLKIPGSGTYAVYRFLTSNDRTSHNDNDVLGVMSSIYGLISQQRLNSTDGWHDKVTKKTRFGHHNRRQNKKRFTKPFFFLNNPVYRGKNFTFRSSDPSQKWLMDEHYEYLQESIRRGSIDVTRLAGLHLSGTLEPFERWATEEDPVRDYDELPDETLCQVAVLNSSRDGLRVGHVVTLRIDIFGSQNAPLLRGGDEIRVWIKDQTQMASMAVDVHDLRNGSYLAHVPLKWAGNSSIFTSLAYPREILRTILYIRTVMRAVRLNAAGFFNPYTSEATLCSPFPIAYNNPKGKLCNMTMENDERSWYCDHPTSSLLSCEDWTEFRDLEFPKPLPMTKGEKTWFDKISNGKKHYLRIMSSSVIKLKVDKAPDTEKEAEKAQPLCSQRPPRETWLEKSPRGMIHGMVWIPFGCRMVPFNTSLLQSRLRNYTVYMIGDSNLRIWQEVLFKNGVCRIDPVKVDKVTGKERKWHDPVDCVNPYYNFVIKWHSHALPFHTNPTHWAKRGNMRSVAYTLDDIFTRKKLIVVIHLYIHLSTHHASVYRDRIRAMRQGVDRLLERIPAAKIFIRGPHVAYNEWPAFLGGDAQGPLFRQVIIDEFKGLYDKVIFLDFWDMSIAGENKEFHPSVYLTYDMMNVFFNYALD